MFRITLILLLIVFSFSINAQNKIKNHEAIDIAKLRCTYLFTFQRDSTNALKIGSERMDLFIGEKCSRYKSYGRIKMDSMIQDFENRGIPMEIALADISIFPKLKYEHQVYKNFPKGSFSVFDRVHKDKFVYDEPMDCFNWIIKSDTATILSYKCQKAITNYKGRSYEAWFTKEIPLSEGPYKFHGLPGLIVKIADTKNHYSFELLSTIVPPKGTLIYFPTYPTICTTREGLMKVKRDAKQDIIKRLEDMGGSFSDPETREKAKKRAMEKARRRNNPIELL
ncbi:GLPGLI family protein [Marinifilum caeruleilacunae]|uniref:GLPGLI family protein n=1 Tax=Marinifilum caeruleilacunae TaxID=2499076 RepID=A0ABX1WZG5_9BACT|nr:GLPGLI family protein [Marinifilum caeruleilacunae]NOU61356.1 GLPGLI family protein [Marinifilum caeruleilacunae]